MNIIEISIKILSESWTVLGQMSPWLLFGFLFAGVLSVWMSPVWIERHLGSNGFGSVWKASLFGIPLPLCSCGVIPVSASLRQQGASRAATTSFLLSTPQTGVDSITITYALLGPVFAVFRPIVALITGIIGGTLVKFLDKDNNKDDSQPVQNNACSDDACEDVCVESNKGNAFLRILEYGFVKLPYDIGTALLIGILLAGMMSAIVPSGYLGTAMGGGLLSIILLMALGVPIYVCATASVPIAAGFMYMGASPGAALAFLIAGPATNAAAFLTTWKILGRPVAITYLGTVAISAVGGGLLLNWMMPMFQTAIPELGGHSHLHGTGSLMTHLWAVIMLLVLVYSYWSTKYHKITKKESIMESEQNQQRLEFLVIGMNCNHCSESVERGLARDSGVRNVDVDLSSGRVVVAGNDLDQNRLFRIVDGLGYSASLLTVSNG
ncbi:MAG: SO_0444 family Cu/Zn efflux transporter [Candidatus Electryoneaceae bacterium]|nr:SO_0444 family Cu/Zn efflux transporter [Candidatus Electryoneaceae bacterium]